jgi:hypothetical protein
MEDTLTQHVTLACHCTVIYDIGMFYVSPTEVDEHNVKRGGPVALLGLK